MPLCAIHNVKSHIFGQQPSPVEVAYFLNGCFENIEDLSNTQQSDILVDVRNIMSVFYHNILTVAR